MAEKKVPGSKTGPAPKAAAGRPARAKAAPNTPPPTKPVADTKPAPAPAAPNAYADTLAMLPQEQREAIESLSANLARAAVTAQGAIADAALRQAERPPALQPDPFHITPALAEVMGKLASQPDRMLRAQADLFSRYMDLWQAAARRAGGEQVNAIIAPKTGDKRFNDPEWTDQPLFDVMKQSYLLTSEWLNTLVSEVDGIALREVVATKGASLAKGMENFAADLARGEGQLLITQTDEKPFEVGRNIATSPGKVIYQNGLLQLLQFAPSTEQVHEIPLLIFPPWINKWYILDLRVENSMIRWLTAQGFTVFVASWVNPNAEQAAKGFEDYMLEGVYDATAQVMKQTGVDRVNTVGYCIGGTLLAVAMAHMAKTGDARINSATFFASQQDFTEAGDLALFTSDDWVDDIERRMEADGGYLRSQSMADTFNALRANDLIWSFFVNNYLLGKEPKPFDLLFWNADQTRMPKALHLSYLREFYGRNLLSKGELVLGGQQLDMSKIMTPVFIQASKDDHISPFRSVYKSAHLFGGPTTFTLAGSGHIAGVINPPSANKYQHWVNPTLPPGAEDWLESAEEHAGSWWPVWSAWLKERSGGLVPARDPATGPLKPIEDAPGSFVLVRY
jgi:polyhydroxyalkanoate synthase